MHDGVLRVAPELPPPLRTRPAQTARGAPPPGRPPVRAPGEVVPARRADQGVGLPARSGRGPDHPRGRADRPHHHRVVDVGHHECLRVPAQRLGDRAGGAPHLRDPVELVAAEVEQDQHVGANRVEHRTEMQLVDLEHAQPSSRLVHQGGDRSVEHVRPGRVVRDRPAAAQRGRHEVTRGGLAVRAGDDDGGHAGRQTSQHIRAQTQRHPAAHHRAHAEPQPPGRVRREPARRHRHPRPERLSRGRHHHPLAPAPVENLNPSPLHATTMCPPRPVAASSLSSLDGTAGCGRRAAPEPAGADRRGRRPRFRNLAPRSSGRFSCSPGSGRPGAGEPAG